ncbi:MAG: tripartite tricarboxylate transporter permease, partial [Nanoarchaeota archaeon]|nr:tripartite tricarboxylate transporter permease [Nanoarchaeota archaeon]
HTFIDFIPSVFLGCPDTDTELSILPGHELLQKGYGYSAIILTAYGSLAAIFILTIIAWPSIFILKNTYSLIRNIIPYLLILASIFLILSEKQKSKALFVFLLTGALGWITFNLEINQSLLPLLTGLFGASNLILSIKNKTKIPPQSTEKIKTPLFKPLLGSLIASPLCSFLPGLGSGQAAIIGNIIARTDRKSFLVLLGATNTLVMGFSFIALYAISKTRTGAAVAIQEIIENLTPKTLLTILITVLITGIIAFFLTKKLALIASKKIEKINYFFLTLLTLLLLVVLVFLVSGPLGFILFLLSTATGIYSILLGVRRTNMMGCLLLPTILLYLL